MEMADLIVNMIQNLGFPIVMSLALLYTNHKQLNSFTETVQMLDESLDNNTEAVNRLLMVLDKKGD